MGKSRGKSTASSRKLDTALNDQGIDASELHRQAREQLIQNMNEEISAQGE